MLCAAWAEIYEKIGRGGTIWKKIGKKISPPKKYEMKGKGRARKKCEKSMSVDSKMNFTARARLLAPSECIS